MAVILEIQLYVDNTFGLVHILSPQFYLPIRHHFDRSTVLFLQTQIHRFFFFDYYFFFQSGLSCNLKIDYFSVI